MKKTITLLLAFVLCLSLCACGRDIGNSISSSDSEKYETETVCSHEQTQWLVEQQPSLRSNGTKLEVCRICGETINVASIPYELRTLEQCYGYSTIRNQGGMYLSIEYNMPVMSNAPSDWRLESCGQNRFYLKDLSGFYVLEYYGGCLKMEEDTGYTEQQWILLENTDGAFIIANADSPNYYLRSDEMGNLSVVRKSEADTGCLWYIQSNNLESGLPYFEITGQQGIIYLRLSPEVLEIITIERLQQWANDLEMAYEAYAELTGWRPFSKVEVRGYTDCGGWGYVYRQKPVIHVNKDCLYEDLQKMSKRDNDWNFGVLHEMSHLFDKEKWGFEWEALAHYKVAYVLYKYDAFSAPAEFSTDKLFSHNTLKNAFYQLDGRLGSGNISIQKPLAGKMLEITEVVGWDAVKKTFCSFPEMTNASDLARFEQFLNLLGEHGSIDVKSLFSNREWEAVVEALS